MIGGKTLGEERMEGWGLNRLSATHKEKIGELKELKTLTQKAAQR